jgi:hypothetical protein
MRILIAFFATVLAAHAATRTSEHYAITADTIDFGGQRVTSTNYSADGSIGPIIGVSGEAATPTVAKHGYIGQLYDLMGYALWATDDTPDELGTTQVFPVRLADDGTGLALAPAGFDFSVVNGPLTGISAGGLVTAGAVYAATPASVGATSIESGLITRLLTVQDTLPDNFGSYAGDALGDAWQVQYFGTNSPLAAPGLDPDGDGQKNLFEFTAGLVPTDAASVFRLRIEPVSGQPAQKRLVFSPVQADRTYVIKARTNLTAGGVELTNQSTDGLLPERRVTDLSAGGARRFYEVQISKP